MAGDVKLEAVFTGMYNQTSTIWRRGLNQAAIAKGHNVLITSMMEFNPIARQIRVTDVAKIDKHICKHTVLNGR